jgi:hypothetical protein
LKELLLILERTPFNRFDSLERTPFNRFDSLERTPFNRFTPYSILLGYVRVKGQPCKKPTILFREAGQLLRLVGCTKNAKTSKTETTKAQDSKKPAIVLYYY